MADGYTACKEAVGVNPVVRQTEREGAFGGRSLGVIFRALTLLGGSV